ncbi:MAG TPA: N-acetyl sugar amidotransferase [Opitutaceae bacterium]|nr:N-acetyl sugar amidotransferase [Opitutaceae bacterium]
MSIPPYRICVKTVMDSSDPGTTFDESNICNHYWDFQNTVQPNWHPDKQGRQELERRVDEIKKSAKGRDFDCLVGLSGGVDSSYMLHTMVKEFGLRPLVFHVDGGWNSELAVHNIHVLVDKLGLDLYTEVINWEEMRDFQLAMFKSGVPHIDIPQDHAFIAVLYNFAEKYKISTILNGGNIATECVMMPGKYYYWGTDMVHIRDILARYGTIPMQTYPFSSVFRHKLYLRYIKGVKVLKPLNYIPYTKQLAFEMLSKEYGWKPYPQKHFESRFTRFYESYWLPARFGFDVRRNQLSSLILTGQITRDQALIELQKPPYDPVAITQEFEYIATKLGISTDELRHYQEIPKKFYWDYRSQHKLLTMIEKVVSALRLARRGGAF